MTGNWIFLKDHFSLFRVRSGMSNLGVFLGVDCLLLEHLGFMQETRFQPLISLRLESFSPVSAWVLKSKSLAITVLDHLLRTTAAQVPESAVRTLGFLPTLSPGDFLFYLSNSFMLYLFIFIFKIVVKYTSHKIYHLNVFMCTTVHWY